MTAGKLGAIVVVENGKGVIFMRIIKSMEDKYLLPSLDLIEAVFTDYENPVDAKITRNLAEEIRAGRFYVPVWS